MRTLLLLLSLLALPLQAAPRTINWEQLIPADAPPPQEQIIRHEGGETGPQAAQVGVGAPVVSSFNGQEIRLPGYLVPVEVDSQGRMRQFLLVPYYGACIHVPPPPSNQIVLVDSEQAPDIGELWRPYWVSGQLQAETSRSELAESGYRMRAARVKPYPLELLR